MTCNNFFSQLTTIRTITAINKKEIVRAVRKNKSELPQLIPRKEIRGSLFFTNDGKLKYVEEI